jgi:hypothetical protein
MVAVATGGPRIQEVNPQYTSRRDRIAAELRRRGLEDPNPHGDLWAWYGRWSSGDMPSWASRRAHLSEMYQPLIDQIRSGPSATGAAIFEEPTGWPRVDRGIYELRRRLEQAQTEEQFQAVGLLCRETLISVAQVVYDPQRLKLPRFRGHPDNWGRGVHETGATSGVEHRRSGPPRRRPLPAAERRSVGQRVNEVWIGARGRIGESAV